ncbi:prpf39 related protein [Cyclospora cayetanensis]|uniref:Prpf39 related protein n=1 Tax=Cyclospora cayetanensis TaxID=88456 RepID=A0A1D3DAE4_9EIME|nr:prpf39 related protein [Cyclospora cayetanensis]
MLPFHLNFLQYQQNAAAAPVDWEAAAKQYSVHRVPSQQQEEQHQQKEAFSGKRKRTSKVSNSVANDAADEDEVSAPDALDAGEVGGINGYTQARDQIGELLKQADQAPYSYEALQALVSALSAADPERLDEYESALERLLFEFPLLFGYWKKLAKLQCDQKGDWNKCDEVFERSLEFVGHNPLIWTAYFEWMRDFASLPPHLVRARMDQAIERAGAHWKAWPLWQSILDWEEEELFTAREKIISAEHGITKEESQGCAVQKFENKCQEREAPESLIDINRARMQTALERLRMLYFQLLRTPLEASDLSWERLKTLVEKGSRSSVKMSALASLNAVDKECWQLLRELLGATLAQAEQRRPFEQATHRWFWHPDPLAPRRLCAWREYLDFEEKNAPERLDLLQRRCLEVCACYPEFWLRCAKQRKQKSVDDALSLLEFGTTKVLKRRRDMACVYASQLEACGRFKEAAREFEALVRPPMDAASLKYFVALLQFSLRHPPETATDGLSHALLLLQEAADKYRDNAPCAELIHLYRAKLVAFHEGDTKKALCVSNREEEEVLSSSVGLLPMRVHDSRKGCILARARESLPKSLPLLLLQLRLQQQQHAGDPQKILSACRHLLSDVLSNSDADVWLRWQVLKLQIHLCEFYGASTETLYATRDAATAFLEKHKEEIDALLANVELRRLPQQLLLPYGEKENEGPTVAAASATDWCNGESQASAESSPPKRATPGTSAVASGVSTAIAERTPLWPWRGASWQSEDVSTAHQNEALTTAKATPQAAAIAKAIDPCRQTSPAVMMALTACSTPAAFAALCSSIAAFCPVSSPGSPGSLLLPFTDDYLQQSPSTPVLPALLQPLKATQQQLALEAPQLLQQQQEQQKSLREGEDYHEQKTLLPQQQSRKGEKEQKAPPQQLEIRRQDDEKLLKTLGEELRQQQVSLHQQPLKSLRCIRSVDYWSSSNPCSVPWEDAAAAAVSALHLDSSIAAKDALESAEESFSSTMPLVDAAVQFFAAEAPASAVSEDCAVETPPHASQLTINSSPASTVASDSVAATEETETSSESLAVSSPQRLPVKQLIGRHIAEAGRGLSFMRSFSLHNLRVALECGSLCPPAPEALKSLSFGEVVGSLRQDWISFAAARDFVFSLCNLLDIHSEVSFLAVRYMGWLLLEWHCWQPPPQVLFDAETPTPAADSSAKKSGEKAAVQKQDDSEAKAEADRARVARVLWGVVTPSSSQTQRGIDAGKGDAKEEDINPHPLPVLQRLGCLCISLALRQIEALHREEQQDLPLQREVQQLVLRKEAILPEVWLPFPFTGWLELYACSDTPSRGAPVSPGAEGSAMETEDRSESSPRLKFFEEASTEQVVAAEHAAAMQLLPALLPVVEPTDLKGGKRLPQVLLRLLVTSPHPASVFLSPSVHAVGVVLLLLRSYPGTSSMKLQQLLRAVVGPTLVQQAAASLKLIAAAISLAAAPLRSSCGVCGCCCPLPLPVQHTLMMTLLQQDALGSSSSLPSLVSTARRAAAAAATPHADDLSQKADKSLSSAKKKRKKHGFKSHLVSATPTTATEAYGCSVISGSFASSGCREDGTAGTLEAHTQLYGEKAGKKQAVSHILITADDSPHLGISPYCKRVALSCSSASTEAAARAARATTSGNTTTSKQLRLQYASSPFSPWAQWSRVMKQQVDSSSWRGNDSRGGKGGSGVEK